MTLPHQPTVKSLEDPAAEILFVSAKGFLLSAIALAETARSPVDQQVRTPGIYLMLSYCLELGLKAVVRWVQGDTRGLGHDLEKAREAALACGFDDLPEVGWLAGELQEAHEKNQLRYIPQVDWIKLPPLERSVTVLRGFIDGVEEFLEVRGGLVPLEELMPAGSSAPPLKP